MTTSRRSRPSMSGNGSRTRSRHYGTTGDLLPTPRPCSGKRSNGVNTTEILQSIERQSSLLPTPTVGDSRNSRNATANDGEGSTGQKGYTLSDIAWLEDRGCSPPATPASPSPMPGSGPARMTPGTSGRGFSACLPASTPTVLRGFVWKMSEGTSAWGSTVCSLTWTTSATPQRRGLFLLRASARSTAGTGCGSSDAVMMPTPTAVTRPNEGSVRLLRQQVQQGLMSEFEAEGILGKSVWEAQGKVPAMWPTPTVQDGKNDAGPSQWERNSDPLNGDVQRAQLLPTPNSCNASNDVNLTLLGDGREKPNKLGWAVASMDGTPPRSGQKLNPAFVSRLMGYPDGWTELSDSEPA